MAFPVKKEKLGNISKYNTKKIICTLPSNGLHSVSFIGTDEDNWFVDVVKYKTKSGIIQESCMIVAKDIPRWREIYRGEGFIV
jgi:hypothetical protein